MTMSTLPTTHATPVVVPKARGALWLFGTVALGLVVFYFIGLDQGATSVFGGNMYVHEFFHDARHFLGFPCH